MSKTVIHLIYNDTKHENEPKNIWHSFAVTTQLLFTFQ